MSKHLRFYLVGVIATLFATSHAVADSTKLEAESANLGADYSVINGDGITYITITSNSTGESPGSGARVAIFSITFPAAGNYTLYARVRCGSGAASDDSFFYGNGFGIKSPTTAGDWIRVNNLNSGGFTNGSDVATGSGSAGVNVWKWVNLSEFANSSSESGRTFDVPPGNLTQTFQIGAREDGFDLDSFVFGSSGLAFTVANLDAGEDGTTPPTIPGECTVNWTAVYQRIDGFGASSAWRSTWNQTLGDMFFSTNTGIGLSLLRTRISPGGGTVENSIMQLAQARGAKVWSAPWSPAPAAQFKSNGNVNGGSFISNDANYQAYASQLAGYAVNMKKLYGVDLYALSVQNEPDANVTSYESCNWTAQQIHDFVPYLHAALVASNLAATKIILPESQNWTDPQGLRLTTMNDPSVAALVDIIANHNYVPDNNNGDQNPPAAINNYGKALWETEVSTFNAYDGGINNGIYWAKRLHAFLTVAQVNAWHYWWLASSGDNNEGLAGPGDVLAKRGYVVGQYSRFVRPDNYRIGVVTNLGTALVSAFKDPVSSRFTIVAINPGNTLINQTFNLNSFGPVSPVTPWITSSTFSLTGQSAVTVTNSSFSYLLPAMSVVTFVGTVASNTAPVLAPVPDQTVNAGVTLVITNQATDPDLPSQTLTFTLIDGPTNAAVDTSSGILTWRPFVSQADTTNTFAVKVADNGTPGLNDTNNFKVTVNPLNHPALGFVNTGNGQITLTANGAAGPDFTLFTSTNLIDWQFLLTTNPQSMPLNLSVTNEGDAHRYYRIELGP